MYFIGDTHGVRPIFTIIDKHKLENANLIHVGDLGLGFQEITRDVKNLLTLDEMLLESNNTLYAIRGNHDNPIFWNRRRGLVLPKLHNVHLIDDYQVRIIESKIILFAGGAISIDRSIRKDEKPPTWWEDEVFTYERDKVIKAFHEYGKIDIVVTHSAPGFAYPQNDYVPIVDHYCAIEKAHGEDLRGEIRHERELLSDMYKEIVSLGTAPSHWFYGHFHGSKKTKVANTEFKLLNVNELYELN